jgi:hypothetical protein
MKTSTLATLALLAISTCAWGDVYVTNYPYNAYPSVLRFGTGAIGDTPPLSVISGPASQLLQPLGIAVDGVHHEIYVADYYQQTIYVYPSDATGDVTPSRQIILQSAGAVPLHLSVDTINDELVVSVAYPAESGVSFAINVYPREANGDDVAPLRTIEGDATLLYYGHNIIADPADNEIIVNSASAGGSLGDSGVLTFARDATGDAAPTRVLAGGATNFGAGSVFLALDADADEIYTDHAGITGWAAFPRTASGGPAPSRVVGGTNTGLTFLGGLAFDGVNHRLVTINKAELDGPNPGELSIFEASAHGAAAPVLSVAGPHTQLSNPFAVAIDDDGGFSAEGTAIYRDLGAFVQASSQPLSVESFNSARVTSGHVTTCHEPVSAQSDDACFAPGDLQHGFKVMSTSGAGIRAAGAGYSVNATPIVGALFVGDTTILELDRPTKSLAFDAVLHGLPGGYLNVALFDEAGRSVAFTYVWPTSGDETAFVGAISQSGIARAELTPSVGSVFLDNVRFDLPEVIFANGFDG